MGRSGCPTKGGNWGGTVSPCRPKSLNFPLLLDITPTKKSSHTIPLLITDHLLGKGVSLIALREILLKLLFGACIFSYTIMTYLKKLDGTKTLNAKQCPLGSSPRIIPQVSPFLPKMSPPLMLFCCTHEVWTVTPFLCETLWETLGMGENPTQQSNIYSFLPPEKCPLIDLHLPLSRLSFLPPSNSNFHVITLCQLHL